MQPCPCYRAVLERCSSGLRGTPGKRVYSKRVSGVRISFSPQTEKENQRQVHLNADFLFPVCTAPPQAAGDVGATATKSQERRRRAGPPTGDVGTTATKSPREGGVQDRLREMPERQRRNLREKEVRGTAYRKCRGDRGRNPGKKEARWTAYGRCRGARGRNLREKEACGAACERCRSASGRNPGEKEARGTACGRCRSASGRNLREKEARGTAYGLSRSSMRTTC